MITRRRNVEKGSANEVFFSEYLITFRIPLGIGGEFNKKSGADGREEGCWGTG